MTAQTIGYVGTDARLIQAINAWLAVPFDAETNRLPGAMLEPDFDRDSGHQHTSRLTLHYEPDHNPTDFTLAMRWQRSCSVDPNAAPGTPDPTIGHVYLDIWLQAVVRREHIGAARDLSSPTMEALKGRTGHLRFAGDECTPSLEPIGFRSQNCPDNLGLTWRWTPTSKRVTPNLYALIAP